MGSAGRFVGALRLEALDTEAISEMLSDLLDVPTDEGRLLARELWRRSDGNVLFVRQVLLTMAADGVLRFDNRLRCWVWDNDRLSTLPLSDNVIDFLVLKLEKLPALTVEALGIAACMGIHVDLVSLGQILETTSRKAWLSLLPAFQAGLIVQHSDSLHFGHDRIQQAAYRSISEDKKARLHWRIGRTLLAEFSSPPTNDRLFEAVDHLNLGVASIDEDDGRLDLARLNRDAAKRGMQTTDQ